MAAGDKKKAVTARAAMVLETNKTMIPIWAQSGAGKWTLRMRRITREGIPEEARDGMMSNMAAPETAGDSHLTGIMRIMKIMTHPTIMVTQTAPVVRTTTVLADMKADMKADRSLAAA